MKKFTVEDLQQLLDQVSPTAEITGINYKQTASDPDKYVCSIYVVDEAKTTRLKFWYSFKKSLASIFIESSK